MITLAGWAAVAIENARVHETRRPSPGRARAERRRALGDDGHRAGPRRRDARRRDAGARRQARACARRRRTRMAVCLSEGADVVVAADRRSALRGAPRRADRHRDPAVGEAIRTRRPVRVDGDGVRALLHDHDTTPSARSGLVVPLVFRDRALGDARRDRPAGRRPGVQRARRAAPPGVLDHGGGRARDRALRRRRVLRSSGSRPRRPSATGGRASCTTRRCRRWRCCA